MGCLVHVHADVVELGLERLRIVRQRHRDIHRRAVHERLTGEVTPPPVYRDVPCPTLVDPPRLLPFLRCEHDLLAYAAPAIVTPAHKETPPHGNWNGSFHKPRQRSGCLADHGARVFRQAAPRLWSEHVWPHMLACYSRIRSRDRGWFRMMRPWDSLRDDRAHCSAPYVISFSGNNLLHIHHPSRKRRPVWTLDKLLV